MARKGKNLAGQRFGRLVAIEPTEERYHTAVVWKCQCDCGNTAYVNTSTLRNGGTKSCGCLVTKSIKNLIPFEKADILGKRFGRLVAIEPTEERYRTAVIWKCQCDCGNTVSVPVSCLTSGDVSSCGCLRKETGRLAMKKLQKNNVFGTNLSSIKRPDEELQKNNTSGITGVCQVRGVWIAYCAFQGYPYRQYCSSKDEAILVRKILRKKRDEFLNWYNSLSPEEQEREALTYKYSRKEFVAATRQELMNILNENKIK